MFLLNIHPMYTIDCNEDFHQKRRNKRNERFLTTIARQRKSRQKVIQHFRFKYEDIWETEEVGYQSDDSLESNCSAISLDQISLKDIIESILGCYPSKGEQSLKMALNAVIYQIDGYEDTVDIQVYYHYFFSDKILDKMSTLIGSEGVRTSIQINIFKLYEELVTKQPLSQIHIQNLITSSIIPKLIQSLMSGNEAIVERCLQLILLSLEYNTSSDSLLIHILNTNLIRIISMRTDMLRWKTIKSNSSDLKTNRRQLIYENNLSSAAKTLLKLFANCVYRLLGLVMDFNLQMDVFNVFPPLLQKFFACPDPKVISTAIDCLRIVAKNQRICLSIVNTFGSTLLSMTDKNEESMVCSAVFALSTLLGVCPQLITHPFGPQLEPFGFILVNCMQKIVEQKRSNRNIYSNIIEIITIIGQTLVPNTESIRQLTIQLIRLSLIIYESVDRSLRVSVINVIQIILSKFTFESMVKLMNVFDVKQFVSHLIITNDESNQLVSLQICSHIMTVLSESYDTIPEEVTKIKKFFFGKSSDIYYCLEKLSYKTTNESISQRANHILKQIDSKLSNTEDISIVPNVSHNYFVFGPIY